MNRLKFVLFVSVVLLIVSGSALYAQDDATPIKIGLYAPLTGPVAFLGEGFQYGATIAIEDMGGEIEGHPLELVVADNKCNPTDAVTAIRQLIEVDEVDVILGGGCSSATVAAQDVIKDGETPAVSATSTNPT
ncbi:MAG: ABC transporter substrate-binding protein, partial [Anaerolineae bacterium]|nr:ABC transporter substrate-binding protein [Anaerolineae bacterium]